MSTTRKTEPDSNPIYFKQLLSGRDFAADDQLAQQMVNFVYLIGDKSTRECMIIDPAYAVEELLSVAEQDGMKVVGALATHYHPDHVGGSMMGANIDGIATLLSKVDIPIHVQELEAQWVMRTTACPQIICTSISRETLSKLAMLKFVWCIHQVIHLAVSAF